MGTDICNNDYVYLFKVVMSGDYGVGKSNIVSRLTKNEFHIESETTIGIEVGVRSYHIHKKIIKAQLWDISASEKYDAIKRAYYREAKGVLIVYDVTNYSTFKNVERWLKELREYTDANNVVVMLVGNKSDLDNSRQVSMEEAKSFADKEKLLFIETSTLNATNVEEGFTTFLSHIYNNIMSP